MILWKENKRKFRVLYLQLRIGSNPILTIGRVVYHGKTPLARDANCIWIRSSGFESCLVHLCQHGETGVYATALEAVAERLESSSLSADIMKRCLIEYFFKIELTLINESTIDIYGRLDIVVITSIAFSLTVILEFMLHI